VPWQIGGFSSKSRVSRNEHDPFQQGTASCREFLKAKGDEMGDKGKKDKGKREDQKKDKNSLKEKRKQKKDKK
jgi:hypothetical protein